MRPLSWPSQGETGVAPSSHTRWSTYSFDPASRYSTTVLYNEKEVDLPHQRRDCDNRGCYTRHTLISPLTIDIVKEKWLNKLHGRLLSHLLVKSMTVFPFRWCRSPCDNMLLVRLDDTIDLLNTVSHSHNIYLSFHWFYQTPNLEHEWTIRRPHLVRSAAWCTSSGRVKITRILSD